VALFVGLSAGLAANASCNPTQQSHVEQNAPDEAEFERLLLRDLAAFFEPLGPPASTVSYELLRKGATQSGTAYPKYYLWVIQRSETSIVRQGAIRLAAIDRKGFSVTDFLSDEQIRANPDKVGEVFPAALVETIKTRAAATS
jgi:hypothetical protein